ICAVAFILTLQVTLPPSDLAYGGSIDSVFQAATLWGLIGGSIFGLISFPFAYFAVRNLRLGSTALFCYGIVMAEILIVTPFANWLGAFCSFPALGVALIICRFSGWRIFARAGTGAPF